MRSGLYKTWANVPNRDLRFVTMCYSASTGEWYHDDGSKRSNKFITIVKGKVE